MPRPVRFKVEFLPSEPAPVDGLCDQCFNPALMGFTLSAVFLGGMKDYGLIRFCADCDV
jgi:hypothetical protein